MSEKKKSRLSGFVDLLLVGGWASVSVGVGLVSLAAGLVVGGALAIAGGAILGRGLDS